MAVRTPAELRTFVLLRPDVEAVLQRCGLDTYDLLLIDLDGNWTRWVFPSEEAAAAPTTTRSPRPHRFAHILSEGSQEIVAVEQLQALAKRVMNQPPAVLKRVKKILE